jgi:hypothetical protein
MQVMYRLIKQWKIKLIIKIDLEYDNLGYWWSQQLSSIALWLVLTEIPMLQKPLKFIERKGI